VQIVSICDADEVTHESFAGGRYDAVLAVARIWSAVHRIHNDSQYLTPTTLGAVVDNVLPTIDFKSLTGRISFVGRQRAFGVYEFLEHDGNAWLSSGTFEVQNQTGGQTILPDGMSSIGGFGYRDMIILISGVGFALLLFSSVGLFYFCRSRRTKQPEKTLLERIFLDRIPEHPHDSILSWRIRVSGSRENVFHGTSRALRTHAKFADVGFSDSGHLSPEHHHNSHTRSGIHAHGYHFGSVEVSGGNFGGSSAMHHHASRRTSETHSAPRRDSDPRDTNTRRHSHNNENSRDLRRHHHHHDHHHRHHDHGEDPLELTPPPRADVVVAAGVRQGVFDPWMNQWARQQGSQVASRPLHR
jgi:hypothetical protein